MYLIAGLGNPESEYDHTRHNIGFMVINELAKKLEIAVTKNQFDGLYGKGKIGSETVILLKPQTYMNLSGKSIVPFANFYKISSQNILVIQDDIDLEVGALKIRKKGGAGTHNGMKSVIEQLGTQEFPRVRVGIGMPQRKADLIHHVLGAIPEEEKQVLEKTIQKAVEAVIAIVQEDIDYAMNQYNGKE